jgi:hypothetical protein
MTRLDVYKHITTISAVIKDGHTIILPGHAITSYHDANSRFLPLKLKIIKGAFFVEMVLSSNLLLSEGTEITSINGVAVKTIFDQLMERQVRDGNNETYPGWILDHYFREYYSYVFGHPAQFVIEYKSGGQFKKATMSALPKDSINYYRQLRYPHKMQVKKAKEGIVYTEAPGHEYALLAIRDFHKRALKKEYRQHFKTEIKRAFKQLRESQISNLILDLRNNQGGDIEYAVCLLSFLLQENFRVVEQYYKVGGGAAHQLVKTKGQEAGVHKSRSNSFKGKLYVLINGGSFSNSGIVASVLKQHKRAQFAGIETGGNNKVLAGYIKSISLPNTGIHVEIPSKQFMLSASMPLTAHGTIPDIEISENINDVLANKDTQLEAVIQLIESEQGKR